MRASASRRSINAKDARDFAKVRRASASRSAIATHLPQLRSATNLDRDFRASYSDFRRVREMHRSEINCFAFTYRFSFWEADWRMRAREAMNTC